MNSEERLKNIQAYILKMPSLSTTVTKVLEICNNPVSSPNDLNRVISLDPVLTGQVLRLINSAYYGIPNRVTSLTRAIIMLGLNTVKNLVLATSVLTTFKNRGLAGSFSMDDFWEHCLCVGTTSKLIAKSCKVPSIDQEEYFVAGLLHDLGKLPMMACFNDLYSDAVSRCTTGGIPLFLAERESIGFDHCQVGMLIGSKWKLSPRMINAMASHHAPLTDGGEPDNLLLVMSLADQLAQQLYVGDAGNRYVDEHLVHELARHLKTEVNDILAMKPAIEEEIKKARVFLKQSGKESVNAT